MDKSEDNHEQSIEDFLEKFANTKLGAHLQAYLDRVEPAFDEMTGVTPDMCGPPIEVAFNEEDWKEIKIYRFGKGEWIDEPDEMEFDYRSIECEILRNQVGALCGYVTVPEEHPWHRKPYDDIDCEVHGGLTFAASAIYKEGEKEKFKIGFDCSHFNDLCPVIEKIMDEARNRPENQRLRKTRDHMALLAPNILRPTYKNIAYVKAEIEGLVDQMLDAVKHE